MTLSAVPDAPEDPRDESERDYEAAVLDASGLSAREIAAQMGYLNRADAAAAVQRGQLTVSRVSPEEVRARHLIIIRTLIKATMNTVTNPGPMVNRNGDALLDEEGFATPDENTRMNAVDKANRLMEREARLVGTDAPTRSVNASFQMDPSSMRDYLLSQGVTPAQIEAATLAIMSGKGVPG